MSCRARKESIFARRCHSPASSAYTVAKANAWRASACAQASKAAKPTTIPRRVKGISGIGG
ncbi:hypothetical protein GCM10022226_06670 [Sphaerisporangium flaviroseum]|uniref:Uncharacterized protein n=1 Tax=Sphaerisporangium flaviroseum TaxID=509199 RepID=A0ABP7HJE3_9ACTN